MVNSPISYPKYVPVISGFHWGSTQNDAAADPLPHRERPKHTHGIAEVVIQLLWRSLDHSARRFLGMAKISEIPSFWVDGRP